MQRDLQSDSLNYLSIVGIALGIVAVGTVFAMIGIALPTIKHTFNATLAELQWIMNVFGIFVCSSLVTFGRLADIYGRKKIFLLGLVLVAIASFGDALSHSIRVIIALQVLTGMGNAIMLAASQAMMTNEFPQEKRGKAIGLWAAIIGISMAAGPLCGGVLIGIFGWRAIFWTLFTMSIIAIVLIGGFSSETKNLHDLPKLDIPGALLIMGMMASLIIAIVQLASWPLIWVLFFAMVAVLLFICLIKVEKRAVMPIIRADLLKNRLFILASVNSGLMIFFIWSTFFLIPLFLQFVADYNVLHIGLVMLFVALPLMLLSPLVGRFYTANNGWKWVALGFLLAIISASIQLTFGATIHINLVILAMLMLGLSLTCAWGPVTTVAVSTLSLQEAGIAAGTYTTFQEVGGNLGVAVTSMVARAPTNFIHGFHYALFVLLALMVLGLVIAWFMRPVG